MKASIIIPTLNRCTLLHKAVLSIVLQHYPTDLFEIIVVDNGSIDGTRAIVDALIANHSRHQIRYVYEQEPGLLAARHRGAFEAIGELLLFVDDDIEATQGWLTAIIEDFDDARVQLIGGRNLPKYEITPPGWIEFFWDSAPCGGRSCWYLSLLDLGEEKHRINPIYIWGLNFSIRRHTFFELGGFHPDTFSGNLIDYCGDGENGLTTPAGARGLVAVYEPAATVYHFVPTSRMTIEYFERRSYLEGIRWSYSEARRNAARNDSLGTKTRQIASGAIRHLQRLTRAAASACPEEKAILAMRKRLADARRAGFAHHQRAIRRDPNVLRWVLKTDYWDYRLPR